MLTESAPNVDPGEAVFGAKRIGKSHMKSHIWLILTTGFGVLLTLIVLLGLGAARKADQIHSEVLTVQEVFQHNEQILSQVHSEIYSSGILIRDFLLDSSSLTVSFYRQKLVETRSSLMNNLEQLEPRLSVDEVRLLKRLQQEVELYWEAMEPILDWTPAQKMALSSLFLRRQVLPRRQAVLAMADEIRKINESNFRGEQRKIGQSKQNFYRYLVEMTIVSFSLGLLVAFANLFHISRLERIRAEQLKRTEQAEEELRRLSVQLVQAQEDERKSISRELHDEVGQMLTALRLEIGNLEQLRHSDGSQFQAHSQEARRLTGQALQVVRDLAMGLRPSMLDDLGLEPALEWQAREFSRHSGVPVNVQIDGLSDPLPDSHRTCIYRVVQEALTNCARHSQAQNIRITLHEHKEWLSLGIQDDGVGFKSGKNSTRGLGLVGIEERVRELGGKVSILSQPQRGTLLQIKIPRRAEGSV